MRGDTGIIYSSLTETKKIILKNSKEWNNKGIEGS